MASGANQSYLRDIWCIFQTTRIPGAFHEISRVPWSILYSLSSREITMKKKTKEEEEREKFLFSGII